MKNNIFIKLLFIIGCFILLSFAATVNASAGYEYTLTKMDVQDSNGNVLPKIPSTGSFYLETTIRDNVSNLSIDGPIKNMLIITVYAADDSFIDLTYIRFTDTGKTLTLGTLIKQTDKPIAKIKGFVWNSLSGMKPLSNSFTYGEIISPDANPDTPATGTMIFDNSSLDREYCTISNLISSDSSTAFKVNATLRYFTSNSSTTSEEYSISENAAFYVNGVPVEINKENLEYFILNNPVGKIELVDFALANNEYDLIFDRINVEYYATAQISSINDNIITLNSNYINFDSSYIKFDAAKHKIYYSDLEVDFDYLGTGDIISIKYDVTAENSTNSDFLEIYISHNSFTQQMQSKTEDSVRFAGTQYTFIFPEHINEMNVGAEYKVRADIFNRIFTFEKVINPKYYAILTDYTDEGFYDYGLVRLILSTGEVDLRPARTAEIGALAKEIALQDDITKKVIQFTLYNGEIGRISQLSPDGNGISGEVDFDTGSVCGINLSNNAVLIDATKYKSSASYKDLNLSSYDNLQSGCNYVVYGFGEKDKNNAYHYAIITEQNPPDDSSSNMAVVPRPPETDEGEEGTDINISITPPPAIDDTVIIITPTDNLPDINNYIPPGSITPYDGQ